MMENYRPEMSFGSDVAANDAATARGEEDDIVQFLARIARQRSCLEFGVGTGRIAVPLAQTGCAVDGVDLSADMLAALRTRSGADQVHAVLGDMTTTTFEKTYGLVYVVHNSLFNLLHQDDQVRCFENAAKHLDDEGVFVVEAASPAPLLRLTDGQFVHAASVEVDSCELDARRYDAVTQTLEGNRMRLSAEGFESRPIVLRYAWPSELDLMARIAGLVLLDRRGGWNGEPLTDRSERHISTYGRPATA